MNGNPRILILTVYYPPFHGGVESHARNLADFLFNKGFEVTVITRKFNAESPKLETVDGITIRRISPSGDRSVIRKWIMIPIAFLTILKMRRSFDLIYCPGYQGIGIAAVFAGKLLNLPVILQAGNLGVLSCRNWDLLLADFNIHRGAPMLALLKRLVRRIYASATIFACICKEIVEEARFCKIPENKIRYLPNSVDCETFHPPSVEEKQKIRSEEHWPLDRLICIFVGRLSIEKGILDLLEAWKRTDFPNATLVVVGPDMMGHNMDAGPMVKEWIARENIGSRLILYGPSDDIPRLLRASDIFVQPSHYEAFGISVIEAMASGLPVVASRVGGMLDYLVDDKNALLCDPFSPIDLEKKLRRLIEDAALREQLGREARSTVARLYDDKVILEEYSRIFLEVAPKTYI